jgi:hypothetical protein
MPGPGNLWLGGPLQSGTKLSTPPASATGDIGTAVLQQSVTLVHNATSVVDGTILLPGGSIIVDIITDTTTAWNSATSDTLSVGTASGGTQFASGVDVKTAAIRIRPTFTATQLTNMLALSTSAPQATVVASVTPVGSASAGQTTVTILYVQTIQTTLGTS